MEKKITKKILAIIMILMLISTDFFVLGSGLKSYALESSSTTNNKNIEFSAYFKNERGEKVEKLQTSIKNEKLKLYAEITVKNEGYLCDASLELQNSNFKIKDNILSDLIASINQNKVNLKQINAGETAVIELDIEPSIGEILTEEMLLEASDLKLTGKYMETSYKGLSIEATRNVALNLQADENATAELNTDIITNKIFSIDGKDKRVVQLLVKSRLADNQYPIKQTKISVDIPKLGEEEPEKVEVLSLGTNAEYESYEAQDQADSQSMYRTLEEKIIPTYYDKDRNGMSKKWVEIMKNSIITTGGKYSTARMLVDYTNNLYMPLCKLTKKYYEDVDNVAAYNSWKKDLYKNWKDIKITQVNNLDNITIDAGNNIEVACEVELPNIDVENITVEAYYGKILENGVVENVSIIPMTLSDSDEEDKKYYFTAKIELTTGGNYGYTFRVMPKHEMLLESANLNLVKWITK